MNEPEELHLPSPARWLLRRAREILDTHVTPETPDAYGWTIGGGTILAARWEHRQSEDMDLLIPPDTRTLALAPDANPDFHHSLTKAGAKEIDIGRFSTIRFRGGRIEMLAANPEPQNGAITAKIDGLKTRVLSTTQILSGKFRNRSLRPPVRDLYDLAVAAEEAPAALAAAVNSLTPAAARVRLTRWEAQREDYAESGHREIKGAPRQYRNIRSDPAGHATDAVSQALYMHLRIRVNEGLATIDTKSRRGPLQRTYRDPTRLENEFERDGISALLERTGAGARETVKAAVQAMQIGIKSTILELESEGGNWKIRPAENAYPNSIKGGKTQPKLGETPPNPETPPARAEGTAAARARQRGHGHSRY